MSNHRVSECWYAVLIGLANCLVAVPVGLYSASAFAAGGHDAALGWGFALLAIVLWIWGCCCCGWEILLLQLRRADPAASDTVPLVVFCSGIITLLLASSITVTL